MMQDLYWECRICEACGVCTGTEEQCEVYTEYYGLEEKQIVETQFSDDYIVSQEAITPTVATNRGLINWLTGQIVKVVRGDVMAQVTVKIGDNYVSSIMPLKEFEDTGKNEGDTVTTVFKATNVKIML
jgi:molybdopterin-binding protein